MTGKYLNYLTCFFNSSLFRFCFKDKFPELLGETRELRKVFFETIRVKQGDDELWFEEALEKVINKKKENNSSTETQNEIDLHLFDLYGLTIDERMMIKTHIPS